MHMPRFIAPVRAALAIALCAASAAVPALDYPARKPGLWQMRVSAHGMSGQVMQQCIDAASDRKMRDIGQGMGTRDCSQHDLRQEGATLVADSVCKAGASTVTTHSVISGDFASDYRIEMRSSFNPPLAKKQDDTSVIEAKWLGPCKAGQKPGDMMMGNGMKMNMLDMMGAGAGRK